MPVIHLRKTDDTTKILGERRIPTGASFPTAPTGFEWVSGSAPANSTAYEDLSNPITLAQKIDAIVENISESVLSPYAGDISLIDSFLSRQNVTGAINLFVGLKTKIDNANDTAAQTAVAPIVTLLQGAGYIPT